MTTEVTSAIAEIHEQDVAEARALIHDAIRTAGERWLPMNAISDALARELVVLRGQTPCIVPEQRSKAPDPARSIVTWHIVKRA